MRQSDTMTSDTEVRIKLRCIIELLHVEKKIAPTDIHQCLLNVYEEQTVDVSMMRWRMMHFSSGNRDMKDKSHFRWKSRFLQALHAGFCSLLVKTHS